MSVFAKINQNLLRVIFAMDIQYEQTLTTLLEGVTTASNLLFLYRF